MLKKNHFKDFDSESWNDFLKINFNDYVLFDFNYVTYESEYFSGENLTYFLKYNNEIGLVKIYNSLDKIYFSQIYFSDKVLYDLNVIKVITSQILNDLYLFNKPLHPLKEYIHSQKADFSIFQLTDKFKLNNIVEMWVNLNLDKQLLWKNIRSSSRNLINKNKKHIEIRFPKDFSISNYKKLHQEVSGKITRSSLTWELQKKMFDENKLIVCEAYIENKFVGFSFFNHCNYIAQYSISVTKREYFEKYSVNHLIMWEAIKKIKEMGISMLYLGFSRSFVKSKSKVDSINLFKLGFCNDLKRGLIIENIDDSYFETGIFK